MLIKSGYINVVIIGMCLFAAGGIMLGIAPNFILMKEEFGVSAMMMGFLVAAFVAGFVVFGGFLLFKAEKLVMADLRKVVALAAGVVGLSGFLTGFAPNYWGMWILRFAVGLGCIVLSVSMTNLSLNWFPDKLNTIILSGIVSMVVGGIVVSFFGSLIGSVAYGWRGMHSIFGGIGLLAFILWLPLGKSMPSATDGAGLAPPPKGLVASTEESKAGGTEAEAKVEAPPGVLKNRYVWCAAGMLYMLLCFIGVFTFVFIALAGRWDLAVMSKSMIFPMSYYLAAIFNSVVIISGSVIGLRLLTKTGRRKPFSVIPGFLAPIVGLVLFSLPFSGVWIAVILELIVLALFLMMVVIPTWIVQLQELPGVGFDKIVNAVGAVLLISGIAGIIVPVAIGWALDQGWVIFKYALYFFVSTWVVCGLAGLLIPEPSAS